jgi:glycosyltransferase involved in cell wall biosynthesis
MDTLRNSPPKGYPPLPLIASGRNVTEAVELAAYSPPGESAEDASGSSLSSAGPAGALTSNLRGKRAAMVSLSSYPADPRPRRAADALLKEGISVDFLCLEDGKAPRREVLNGINVLRLPVTHRRGGKFAYAYEYSSFILMCATVLGWRSIRHRYDLVYVHNMPDILVLSALIPKMLGAKVVLDQHDPMPELMKTIFNLQENSLSVRIIALLEKCSFALVNRVVTVNVACKRIFSSRSCRPEKISVVMNSPDETIFPFQARHLSSSTSPSTTKPFSIMYHGSIVERNGLDVAVEAFARVRQVIPSAELRIYGSKNSFLERVMEQVHNKGLDGSVHYFGPKRLEELVGEIEVCDVGIIPNHRNSFTDINTPTRIFEYLALGKPVIAPRTQGIQDYFGPDSLFFFEPGDAEELAQKIEYVFSHGRETDDIVRRGQEVYLTHTWSLQKETLVNLVSELLDGGGRA